MKYKKFAILFIVLIILLAGVELKPVEQCYSAVFSTDKGTEIEIHAVMNTLLPIDKKGVVDKIITEHKQINGSKENMVYKIHLYRTKLHYRNNIEYDMVISDRGK